MTNEEIDIEIAKALGWKQSGWGLYPPGLPPEANIAYKHKIPNYSGDLNAMYEAEEILDSNQWETWHRLVAKLFLTEEHPYAIRLTAMQRATAFLKTLGKWEE